MTTHPAAAEPLETQSSPAATEPKEALSTSLAASALAPQNGQVKAGTTLPKASPPLPFHPSHKHSPRGSPAKTTGGDTSQADTSSGAVTDYLGTLVPLVPFYMSVLLCFICISKVVEGGRAWSTRCLACCSSTALLCIPA